MRARPLIAAALTVAVLSGACSGDDPVLVDPAVAPETGDDGVAAIGSDDVGDDASRLDPEPEPETSTVADTLDGTLRPTAPLQLVEVVSRLGHDTTAFTQGLLFDGDRMYESRGLYGESALTEIDPVTGEVLRRVDLDDELFAEGLALVGGRLIQLTWQAGRALVYEAETFDLIGEFTYDGEGWGLCWDGTDLWMSDGTDTLDRRDPDTFEVLSSVDVTLNGSLFGDLNELECVDGLVYANVWRTDLIVAIDPETGEVVSQIDASGLLTDEEDAAGADVLNGIAYDARRDALVITGKNWPAMFEVELIPCVGDC